MPANPAANLESRKVLNWLQQLPQQTTDRVMSGQNLAHHPYNVPQGYANYVEGLETDTGYRPLLVGADFGRGSASDLSRANAVLIDHWNSGGLVTISMHPDNPWTNNGYRDLTHRNLEELITAGTSANQAWMAKVDHIADGLEELRDAGVVVLFRPFHEMNFRSVFWWDMGAVLDDHPAQGEAVWIAMWRHLFDYLTGERDLHNLLWVYAAANYDDAHHGVTRVYPGDAYVDIVGIDLYDDAVEIQGDGYAKLLATGKPFAFTEFGPSTLDGSYDNQVTIEEIRTKYPATAYVLYWHSWTWNGLQHASLRDNLNAMGFLEDSWVANLGEATARQFWDAEALKRLYFPDEPDGFTVVRHGRELTTEDLYLIGGDPLDGDNVFEVVACGYSSANGQLSVRFPTNENRLYHLLESTDLQDWQDTGQFVPGSGEKETIPYPVDLPGRRFFKVKVSVDP